MRREFRLSLQPEAVWKEALIRSLPPGHPSTMTTTNSRRAAYEYGMLQGAIESGDAAARHGSYVRLLDSAASTGPLFTNCSTASDIWVLCRSAELRQNKVQAVMVSHGELFVVCHGALDWYRTPGWEISVLRQEAGQTPFSALCPLNPPWPGP